MNKFIILLCGLGMLWSCNTSKIVNAPAIEFENLDTLVVSAPKIIETAGPTIYNPSATRKFDLLHTKLELAFDWENEKVLGKATLTLKPYFYETDKLVLDAKGFKFNKITLAGNSAPLKFSNTGQQVEIALPRIYKRTEEIKVFLDYVATPRADGGSQAITADKGLYFINPRNEEEGKPQQIWTQGETESNSKWFPTIDKPNERTTQEIYVTVKDKFETLSNGLLISSNKNADGTRTDYWKMDQPHAPYLFMLAIGEFAIVKDKWRNIDVDYYVEEEYRESAADIFPHTPEMMEFFSKQLGVDYPWKKYSQVVVRDFVSGAMENTTASIFGEFVQKHKEDLVDNDDLNQYITAHELFHHWFGDYVTCESWSNLTLNEGFANYSEYMWAEHHSGADHADQHRLNEMNAYISSARNGIHDLIDFEYKDKENMFDAHSYNKGGLILHMLRNYVGDEAFFASLNKYLRDNEYTAVEADELRMAFEDTMGEDLNWFFNQWFFDKGHPEIEVETGVAFEPDGDAVSAYIKTTQIQDASKMPAVFQLPVKVDFYKENGEKLTKEIFINQREQTFNFDLSFVPALINFDADKVLLAEVIEEKTVANYVFQYENAPKFLDRWNALEALQNESTEEVLAMFEKALDDPYQGLREKAVEFVNASKTTVANKLQQLISNDKHSKVRAAALNKIAETENPKYADLILKSLKNEKSKTVKGAALTALQKLDSKAALDYAITVEDGASGELLKAVGNVYSATGDYKYLPFFEKNMDELSAFELIGFMEQYAGLAAKGSEQQILSVGEKLNVFSMDSNISAWKRFGATKGLNDLHIELAKRALGAANDTDKSKFEKADQALINKIEAIKKQETDSQLMMFYNNFPTKVEAKP